MIGQAFSHYRIRDQLGPAAWVSSTGPRTSPSSGKSPSNCFADVANNRAAIDRFLHEARAAAALNHPNICTIYEAGEQDGQPFIAMELLDGQTLQQYLAAGPLSGPRVLDVATQIASGLGAAHAKGIIHRDIKPANVYVAHDGRIKILDFGLAKLKAGLDVVGHRPEDADTIRQADQPTDGTAPSSGRSRTCPPSRRVVNRSIRARICFRSASSCTKCVPAAVRSLERHGPSSSTAS